MKYSLLSIRYIYEIPENQIYLYTKHQPHKATNRQLYLELDNQAEIECIEYECDPNELFEKMECLGHVKALGAVEFQMFENEDYFPGYFMDITELDDTYGMKFITCEGYPYHYIPKADFEYFLEILYRWLKHVVCNGKKNKGLSQNNTSLQNYIKSALARCKIISEIEYNEIYYNISSIKVNYNFVFVLYPKICACSIEMHVGAFSDPYDFIGMEFSCNMYVLMDALEMQDKISAIESIVWHSEDFDVFAQFKLSDECSSVAELYDINGLSRSMYIINKEKLLCLLDNVYNILK